jgi:hypothetical protein
MMRTLTNRATSIGLLRNLITVKPKRGSTSLQILVTILIKPMIVDKYLRP